jgi:hypothetical protein
MLNKLSEEWFKSPTLAAGCATRPILNGMGSPDPENGSILAEAPFVQSVEQAEQWYRARARTAYMSAMRGKLAWLIVLDIFVVAVLALAGYPMPRVVALAVTFCASLTMFLFWLSRNAVSAPKGASGRAETLHMAPRFLLMFVTLGLTGGLRSPLLPAALIPFSDVVIKNGWSQTAKSILVLIATGLCALALLPGGWFGPDVPQPAYWILLLATLATAGAWHTRYALLLTRTVGDNACELGRAREEMVYRALARAREIEQIGWKLSHELKNPLAAIKGLVQLSAATSRAAIRTFPSSFASSRPRWTGWRTS